MTKMTKNLYQVEKGNFTRIVNIVIDELVKIPLPASEIQICLFIIRKTWGFNKVTDKISLTQFEQATNKSRPTVVKALKNLQLVNILLLVKKGTSVLAGNEWKINKYTNTWKLVNIPKLVKSTNTTSKVLHKQLVNTPKHTKDNIQKTIQKTNKYTSITDLDNSVLEEICLKYKVPLAFVISKLDDLQNYCAAKNKRYSDYKAALMHWVKKDALKIIERKIQYGQKSGIDATNLTGGGRL